MQAQRPLRALAALVVSLSATALSPLAAGGVLELGPEQIVQAGGSDLTVLGYSVPSCADWNNDGKKDLIVGEGGGTQPGKVRIYLNVGSAASPLFSEWFYAKEAGGSDLSVAQSGCLGIFPRVAYWDADDRKDLIAGRSDGTVVFYHNAGSDADPSFDAGTLLEVGPLGAKSPIDVGTRATLDIVDWDENGLRDLVMGAYDGKIRVYLNDGTDTSPDYAAAMYVKNAATGADLVVPSGRSSPVVADLDDDGRKDLLVSNTNGQLLLYSNQGTNAAPVFSSAFSTPLAVGIEPVDLPGSDRGRASMTYWTDDPWPDLLVGYGDGKVHLFEGVPEPAALLLLAAGVPFALRRRRRS
jgi:hypothetical protein